MVIDYSNRSRCLSIMRHSYMSSKWQVKEELIWLLQFHLETSESRISELFKMCDDTVLSVLWRTMVYDGVLVAETEEDKEFALQVFER